MKKYTWIMYKGEILMKMYTWIWYKGEILMKTYTCILYKGEILRKTYTCIWGSKEKSSWHTWIWHKGEIIMKICTWNMAKRRNHHENVHLNMGIREESSCKHTSEYCTKEKSSEKKHTPEFCTKEKSSWKHTPEYCTKEKSSEKHTPEYANEKILSCCTITPVRESKLWKRWSSHQQYFFKGAQVWECWLLFFMLTSHILVGDLENEVLELCKNFWNHRGGMHGFLSGFLPSVIFLSSFLWEKMYFYMNKV